jgi:hypothetical protein
MFMWPQILFTVDVGFEGKVAQSHSEDETLEVELHVSLTLSLK